MSESVASPGLKTVPGGSVNSRKRPRVFSYKLALLTTDMAAGLGAAVIGTWILGQGAIEGMDALQQAVFMALCLTPVAFFHNFHLYSYHLIYFPRRHLMQLAKACGLGLFSLAIMTLTFKWPEYVSPDLFIPSVVAFSLAVLLINRFLVNRFLEDKIVVMLKALGLALFVVGLIMFLEPPGEAVIPQHLHKALFGCLLAAFTLAVVRCLMVHLLFNVVLRRRFRRQVLLIGMNQDAERITDLIIRQKAPFWIAGTVSPLPSDRLFATVPKGNLGRIQDLEAILGEQFFQEAIITDETIEKAELIRLLDFFTTKGIDVWFLPKLMPIIEMKLYTDNLCGMPMIRLSSRQHQWLFRRIKYAFDAVAVLIGFIMALPLFAAFALAIKLTSEGSVFYRAQAVGKGGRFFDMYKFRSMITGASKEIHKEYVTRLINGEITPDGSGKPIKITNDSRVTRVGRILRKTSLDELPQLINILKGEMSLVGPRPCLPYEYKVYKEWHKKRTAVRPGITGLWQVVGRSEVSFEDMILLDLYYIYNRSMDLDLSILFETVFVVLKKKGAH
ncbi:MAG TPA: sugar transferase [Desulfobacterales bacterium]|nr:sugar transferase [Desulfobacterales bacterium]